MASQGEIVVYQPDEITRLEVRVEGETVWLTQEHIASLFGVKRPAITKHIRNIFAIQELDENSVCSILERTASDGKSYMTQYYNLDMILSVGYRVNSKNAVLFRRWANSVLKEYMLRGFAVNQRLLHLEEKIDQKFYSLEQRVEKTEEKIDFFVRTNQTPVEQVFFGGEFFAARVLLEKLVKTAKNKVIIIDAYVDAATFEILDVRAKNVAATIYCGKDLSGLRDVHNATAGVEPIDTFVWSHPSHDRWLIVDDQLYHCGHSLKDIGKKLSAISLMGIPAQTIIDQVK